ncbi:MAG: sarcosine oxidase subunit delta [Acidiferrobacteraceae bacterium]|nr:sarcosine oxidase subunit delta [Acidiferrobacteraceae bacterium]
MRINCPFCGFRDHSEFTYGGDASIVFPDLDASSEAWIDAVFHRDNIDGVQRETWHHVHGCRMWVVVTRDTVTHEISAVEPAHQGIKLVLEAMTGLSSSDEDQQP